MAATNGVITRERFKSTFTDLHPLILAEWPEVDEKLLVGTEGDLEKVVELVAKKTEHTKTFVKKQLDELSQVAVSEVEDAETRIRRMLTKLELKTHEISGYVKENMLPGAEQKVRDNLLVSLLTTVCFGFLLGFIFRGFGRGR